MMIRVPIIIALAALALAALPAHGQFRDPRSGDYLFSASAQDARALWVNPAGLAAAFEAVVMGEVLVERSSDDDFMLRQITVGFNSRGFGFGFRRDRFENSVGGNTLRIGFGRALGRIAVGASLTVYSDSADQRELDLGIRGFIFPGLEFGAAVQHIFEPLARDSLLPATGRLGAALTLWQGTLQLNTEAFAANRPSASGYEVGYRAGLTLRSSGRTPLGLLAAVDLSDDVRIDRIVVGFVLGGRDRGIITGHGGRRNGTAYLDGIGLTGVASRRLQ
jgi:hypothetical protein